MGCSYNIPRLNTPIRPNLVFLSIRSLDRGKIGMTRMTMSPTDDNTPLVTPMLCIARRTQLPGCCLL